MNKLSENKMWEVSIANDASYDGVFYYAVKTTGVVCRPSCKSKIPNRDNVSFFRSFEEAIHHGYRPCKRCRPDLGARYAPEKESIESACNILKAEYHNPEILEELPSRVGISSFHFQRLFKKVTAHTPKEFLQGIRVNKAAELLVRSKRNNTDICLTVGFKSLSGFYSAFRLQKGCSPREYRKTQESKMRLQ